MRVDEIHELLKSNKKRELLLNARLKNAEELSDMIKRLSALGNEGDMLMFTAKRLGVLRDEINSLVDCLVDDKRKMLKLIELLDDDLKKAVLTERSLNMTRWDDLQDMLGYDSRHLQRVYKKAVEEIAEKMRGLK